MKKIILIIFTFIIALSLFSCGEIFDEPAAVTAGLNQKIYIVGGMSAQSMLVSTNTVGVIDMFDPVNNVWYPTVTSLPTPVSFAAVVSYRNKIFVLGGFDNTGTHINTVQIYNTSTNSWSYGTPMTNARANHSAVVINGKIYVTRGTTDVYNIGWVVTGVPATTLIYTISTDTWANGVADSAVSNKAVVPFGDIVYYLGGRGAATTAVNTFDGISTSYSASGIITSVVELILSGNRVGHSAVVFQDSTSTYNVLVMGGFSALAGGAGSYIFNTNITTASLTTFEYCKYPFFGPNPSAWTSAGVLPEQNGFGAAVISGSTLYYFGGTTPGDPPVALSRMYSYNLNIFPSGSWTNHGSVMPRARFGHTAVLIQQ
jgi:hypothetical protein